MNPPDGILPEKGELPALPAGSDGGLAHSCGAEAGADFFSPGVVSPALSAAAAIAASRRFSMRLLDSPYFGFRAPAQDRGLL